MAARNLHLLLNNSPLCVSARVCTDPLSSSNFSTILTARSQMRMMASTTAKPAVLQIGPALPMLREALERKYDVYALEEQEDEQVFLVTKGPSIRGVVTCTQLHCDPTRVDKELVRKLPNLEIVSSFDDSDVDKVVDVHHCKKLGVQVTDTRDAVPNVSAATAVRLLMAISREVVDAGHYVRACRWPAKGNYPLAFRCTYRVTQTLDNCQSMVSAPEFALTQSRLSGNTNRRGKRPRDHWSKFTVSQEPNRVVLGAKGSRIYYVTQFAFLGAAGAAGPVVIGQDLFSAKSRIVSWNPEDMSKDSKPKVLQLMGGIPSLEASLKASDSFDHYALWEQPDEEAFLAEHGPSFRGIACLGQQRCPVDNTIVSKLPNLEIVATFSVGTDNVDIPLLKSRGVRLTTVGGVTADNVAELAVGLALATSRKIAAADRFVRDGRWASGGSFPLTRQLSNKHVGIVGLGQIGAAIAKRMEAFGCTIAYWSRSSKPQYPNYVYYDNVVNLAKHSDILIGACPLSEETRKVINREVLDALGPHGFVVNVSRGPVIDEQELVSALEEGRIAGAGLDVFENEPNIREEFMHLDTCVLQPHAGISTNETHQAMANMVVANLEAHFSGKPLLTPVC